MPRTTAEAVSGAAWRLGGQRPVPPRYLSAPAKALWREIVDARPVDFFRPGSLTLLEQFVNVAVAQKKAMAALAGDPLDKDLAKLVKDYAAIINSTAIKLRISVQADVDRKSRKTDERGPTVRGRRGLGEAIVVSPELN